MIVTSDDVSLPLSNIDGISVENAPNAYLLTAYLVRPITINEMGDLVRTSRIVLAQGDTETTVRNLLWNLNNFIASDISCRVRNDGVTRIHIFER